MYLNTIIGILVRFRNIIIICAATLYVFFCPSDLLGFAIMYVVIYTKLWYDPNLIGPDIGFGRISGRIPGYWNHQAGYPVSTDIQPYFTEVIRTDIRQFSLLYRTKLILSGRISGQTLVWIRFLGRLSWLKWSISL